MSTSKQPRHQKRLFAIGRKAGRLSKRKITHADAPPAKEGASATSPQADRPCPRCDGTGVIMLAETYVTRIDTRGHEEICCPACHGEGVV